MKKSTLAIVAVAALLAAGLIAFSAHMSKQEQTDGAMDPFQATLSGVQTCLPAKEASGPQTAECAIGIRTDSGEHYALNFDMMSGTPPVVADGQRLTASGLVTPIEMLSSDHWQKYDVKGIFSVTDSVQVEPLPAPVAPVTTAPPVKGECYVGGCSAQLCTDQPDSGSSCEYAESYACYRTATCERQMDDTCGWTETPELRACLSSAN